MKKKAGDIFIQGKPYKVSDMAEAFPQMPAIRKMIIQARLNGPSIWELDDDEYEVFADQVIIRTSAITGTPLPDGDMLPTAIKSELKSMLENFAYDSYTLEEIVLASHLNFFQPLKNPAGNDFKRAESKSFFNIAYVAQILYNYKTLRDHMERDFENKILGH